MADITIITIYDSRGNLECIANNNDIEIKDIIASLRGEDVVAINGAIKFADIENSLSIISAGSLFLSVIAIHILNKVRELPYDLSSEKTIQFDTRMKYRYLDLRTTPIRNLFLQINEISRRVRNFLYDQQFLEISTPLLSGSTEEYGEKEYIVLNQRLSKKYYVLPQSPQVYKQLLMVGGMDRYFQFAKCFRGDYSSNRRDQLPEFTQLDIEMSFVNSDDIIFFVECLIEQVFQELGVSIKRPFQRIKFDKFEQQLRANEFAETRKYEPRWVIDFPLFFSNNGIYEPFHHPFVLPKEDDIPLLTSSPDKVRMNAFELYLNGIEIGGGSMRSNDSDVQRRILRTMGLSESIIEEKYGHLLEALTYGAPPHGGIAIGLERLLWVVLNTSDIREVIAFPKRSDGSCYIGKCPNILTEKHMGSL